MFNRYEDDWRQWAKLQAAVMKPVLQEVLPQALAGVLGYDASVGALSEPLEHDDVRMLREYLVHTFAYDKDSEVHPASAAHRFLGKLLDYFNVTKEACSKWPVHLVGEDPLEWAKRCVAFVDIGAKYERGAVAIECILANSEQEPTKEGELVETDDILEVYVWPIGTRHAGLEYRKPVMFEGKLSCDHFRGKPGHLCTFATALLLERARRAPLAKRLQDTQVTSQFGVFYCKTPQLGQAMAVALLSDEAYRRRLAITLRLVVNRYKNKQ